MKEPIREIIQYVRITFVQVANVTLQKELLNDSNTSIQKRLWLFNTVNMIAENHKELMLFLRGSKHTIRGVKA